MVDMKVCVIGEEGTGKSSLIASFLSKVVEENKEPASAGKVQDLEIGSHYLRFMDTVKDEYERGVATAYFRGASVVLIVAALNDEESLENLTDRIDEVRGKLENPEKTAIIVALNKLDVEDEENETDVDELEADYDVFARKVSALDGPASAEFLKEAVEYVENFGKEQESSDE